MKFHLVTYHDFAKPSEIVKLAPEDPRPFGWASISSGKESEAAVREACGIPDEPCRLCGMIFSTNFVKSVKDKMVDLNICHACNHWQEITEWRTPGFRIDGVHWKACHENTADRPRFKGCGGRRFVIRKLDNGEEITTSNLWCQGRIPNHFSHLLPDNAEFVPEEMPAKTGEGFYAYP